MSLSLTFKITLFTTAAVCALALFSAPALAAPSASQVAAERADVDRAVQRFEAAQQRANRINARVERISVELDRVITDQDSAHERLSSRARMMYRSGDTTFVSVLLGAATFQEFASRWELLELMSRQDAEDLSTLAELRTDAERSAKTLLQLQAEEARAVDATAQEVARARKELAASQSALAAYQTRTRPARRAPAAAPKSDSKQQLRGSGAWRTGVASHYGRNFTGRGASGERIGPYSMMVAHKTLPFGTLIEFKYNGKRAVARVADRGPRSAARMFDLGPGVVRVLNFNGVHEVQYRIISR